MTVSRVHARRSDRDLKWKPFKKLSASLPLIVHNCSLLRQVVSVVLEGPSKFRQARRELDQHLWNYRRRAAAPE